MNDFIAHQRIQAYLACYYSLCQGNWCVPFLLLHSILIPCHHLFLNLPPQDRCHHPGSSLKTHLECDMSPDISMSTLGLGCASNSLWLGMFRLCFLLYPMQWFYNINKTSEVSCSSNMLKFSNWNLQFLVNSIRWAGLSWGLHVGII